MSREPKDTFGLAAAPSEPGSGALKTDETLPRGLVQLAEDFDRRFFHQKKG